MITFQKIILVIAALNLLRGYLHHSKGRSSRYWFGMSSLIWGSLLIVGGLLPELSSRAAQWVGVGRGVDLALYLSVIALWMLVLKIIQKQSRNAEELTALVRAIAVEGAKRPE